MQETIKFNTERAFFATIRENEDFEEYREEKQSNFDSEKGYVDVIVYLRRISDGKKFTASFTRGGQGNRWADDLNFYEVAQRVKKPVPTWSDLESEAYDLFEDNFDNEKFKEWLYTNFETPKRKK